MHRGLGKAESFGRFAHGGPVLRYVSGFADHAFDHIIIHDRNICLYTGDNACCFNKKPADENERAECRRKKRRRIILTAHNEKEKRKCGLWTGFLLFGLVGQIAWAVENMFFNVFLYNSFNADVARLVSQGAYDGIMPLTGVKLMVQLSGLTATVATLLAGAFSDRVGDRRRIISIGYIIWGLTVASFALITESNVAALFGLESADAISVSIILVIIMDCVMTFFGSSANDAAFNAYVTDVTTADNRGKVEGVLSALPLVAMLLVAGAFGIIKDAIGYPALFSILGAVISLTGIAGLFILKDSDALKPVRNIFFADVFYGFRASVIKSNGLLYLTFIGVALYGIASQIFFPYMIIYLEHYLKLSTMEYSVVLGTVIAVATAAVIFFGRKSDGKNKTVMLMTVLAVFIAGLTSMYFVKGMEKAVLIPLLCLTGSVAIFGYVAVLAMFNAEIRDRTPAGSAGKLQGTRIFFYVLLPMFIGPEIGGWVINVFNSGSYEDTVSGAVESVPVPEIFLFAAIAATLVYIPVGIMYRKGSPRLSEKN